MSPSDSGETDGQMQQGRGSAVKNGLRLQKARHLLGAENDGNLARLRDECQVLDDVAPIERNGEEEPQRRNRTVDGRSTDAVRSEMQLEKPQLFGCRRIG